MAQQEMLEPGESDYGISVCFYRVNAHKIQLTFQLVRGHRVRDQEKDEES